jgi:hypothetical protein
MSPATQRTPPSYRRDHGQGEVMLGPARNELDTRAPTRSTGLPRTRIGKQAADEPDSRRHAGQDATGRPRPDRHRGVLMRLLMVRGLPIDTLCNK